MVKVKWLVLTAVVLFLGAWVFGQERIAVLQLDAPRGRVTVMFPAGAAAACTVYQDQRVLPAGDSLRENFPDGHYAPRNCYMLGPTVDRYVDGLFFDPADPTDWKIWVEVFYEHRGQDADMIKSNTVAVRR